MQVIDRVVINILGKGEYENEIEFENGEQEWLNGVALTEGHYCKFYTRKRDWKNTSDLDNEGLPYLQHYCNKRKNFMGPSYCCWTNADCFEKGKSAGIKRIRNKINNNRKKKGLL